MYQAPSTQLAETPTQTLPNVLVSPQQIYDISALYDVHRPTEKEVISGRQIAADRISPQIATADAYVRIEQHSGICPLVLRENGEVTGMMALLLLNAAGHAAIKHGSFDAINPDLNHLSRSNEAIYAGYGWGFVGTTKEAGRALVSTTASIQQQLMSTVDCFTRPATPDGIRVLEGKLGYAPVPWADDTGLAWIPAKEPEGR